MSTMLQAVVFTVVSIAAVSALDNGLGKTPPMGWSTWCSDGVCGVDYCTEYEVKQAAQAMIDNGMHSLGYEYVLLDDCWAAGNRTASGDITWDPHRFPSGIPSLVNWLHAKNLKFGLYTSAGNTTCDRGHRPYPILGSEHHYQRDSNTFASWNVDYVKVDWCGDVHSMPLDGILVGAKDYIAFSHALTNTTPSRAMYFEGVAAYIFLLGEVGKYVNSWRASTDHHDSWRNTMEVIATVQVLGKEGKPGAWSYMDVIMTGGQGCIHNRGNSTAHCPGMTNTEYYSEFTIWSLFQSPLVVASDIRNMTSIMKTILLNDRLIKFHQDTRTAPGKFIGGDGKCTELGALSCQYLVRSLHDGSAIVVLFNAGEESHDISFSFEEQKKHLPFAGNATVDAHDLWTNSTQTESMKLKRTVPSHGVAALHLVPKQ